jgi:hypothetical protein
LLGPIDLTQVAPGVLAPHLPGHRVDVLRGGTWNMPTGLVPPPEFTNHSDMEEIHWVIVGGESGHGARPCHVSWIRSIVRQCREAGTACFVKQLGANVHDCNDAGFMGDPGDAWGHNGFDYMTDIEHNPNGFREEYQGAPVRIHLADSKGGNIDEFPRGIQVRDFPSRKVVLK